MSDANPMAITTEQPFSQGKCCLLASIDLAEALDADDDGSRLLCPSDTMITIYGILDTSPWAKNEKPG